MSERFFSNALGILYEYDLNFQEQVDLLTMVHDPDPEAKTQKILFLCRPIGSDLRPQILHTYDQACHVERDLHLWQLERQRNKVPSAGPIVRERIKK